MSEIAMLEEIIESIAFYRRNHGGAFPTRVEIGREEWRRLCPPPNVWDHVGSFTYVSGVMVVKGNW